MNIKIILFVFLSLCFSQVFLAKTEAQNISLVREAYNTRNKAIVTVTEHVPSLFGINCRQLPESCKPVVSFFVAELQELAERYEIDFWLLVGLAFETTNFNPEARNAFGFAGLLGVNRTEYRRCANDDFICHKRILEASVVWLKESFNECSSERNGLQRYYKNSCGADPRFARHVLRWARNLKARAAEIDDVDVCEIYPILCSRLMLREEE